MTKSKGRPVSKSIVPTINETSPIAITLAEYGGLQEAFDFLNATLFEGKLPDAMFNHTRKPHMRGHFADDRYSGRVADFKRPEIALNPDAYNDRTDEQIISTLAHEMVHLWQHRFGKPSKRGYHNREWAAMMKQIGLMPSNSGMVGGKETGQQMTHYILPGGPYQQAFLALAATGWKLNVESTIYAGGTKAPASKVKFTCPECGSNVWGKPETKDICGGCNVWRVTAAAENAEVGTNELQLEVIE